MCLYIAACVGLQAHLFSKAHLQLISSAFEHSMLQYMYGQLIYAHRLQCKHSIFLKHKFAPRNVLESNVYRQPGFLITEFFKVMTITSHTY